MSNKQEYSIEILETLKVEINKLKESRQKILLLDKLLLHYHKDIVELIKSGCSAKDITQMFKTLQINVGVAKIKQLYFAKKLKQNKSKTHVDKTITQNN